MSEVSILLGGNEGDKHKIFSETIKLISEKIGQIKFLSSVYETEPWGFVSDLFWNQALILTSALPPEEILTYALDIENKMGRKRISDNYEARPIDIDIMLYDDLQINTPRLTIPHSLMAQRRFMLVPLAEIAPEKIHPVTGLTIKEMLQVCPDKLKVSRIEEGK
jgi:2-amino-4-hydroxy-6-hydroxymethyldihydropteridine diphosphokinase